MAAPRFFPPRSSPQGGRPVGSSPLGGGRPQSSKPLEPYAPRWSERLMPMEGTEGYRLPTFRASELGMQPGRTEWAAHGGEQADWRATEYPSQFGYLPSLSQSPQVRVTSALEGSSPYGWLTPGRQDENVQTLYDPEHPDRFALRIKTADKTGTIVPYYKQGDEFVPYEQGINTHKWDTNTNWEDWAPVLAIMAMPFTMGAASAALGGASAAGAAGAGAGAAGAGTAGAGAAGLTAAQAQAYASILANANSFIGNPLGKYGTALSALTGAAGGVNTLAGAGGALDTLRGTGQLVSSGGQLAGNQRLGAFGSLLGGGAGLASGELGGALRGALGVQRGLERWNAPTGRAPQQISRRWPPPRPIRG